jgi:hypothetical protein
MNFSIDPKVSVAVNVGFTFVGSLLGFLAYTKMPSSIPAADAAMVQEWSTWILAGGTAIVGAINVALHATSSDKPGPAVSGK